MWFGSERSLSQHETPDIMCLQHLTILYLSKETVEQQQQRSLQKNITAFFAQFPSLTHPGMMVGCASLVNLDDVGQKSRRLSLNRVLYYQLIGIIDRPQTNV